MRYDYTVEQNVPLGKDGKPIRTSAHIETLTKGLEELLDKKEVEVLKENYGE